MIIGVGVDIIDIRRIEKLLKKDGQRFIDRVFTKAEQKKATSIKNKEKRAAYYAKRFAAKEAYAKAIGTGIGKGVKFQDITVISEKSGKPTLKVAKEKRKIHLSLSDEYPYAQAFVVVESI